MFSSIILFGSFFLFLALGVPIAFVLIVATVFLCAFKYRLMPTWRWFRSELSYGINSFTMLVFHSSLWQEIL